MEPIVAVAAHNRPESTGKAPHAHSNPSKDDILLFIFLFAEGYMGEGPPNPLSRYAAGCSQERAAPMSQEETETR